VQKVVSDATRGLFEREPLCVRVGADIDRFHGNRETDTGGEIAAELFVSRRRATKSMIQVCERHDRKRALLRKVPEQEHQRNRV
jgi:hypothetical protein